MKKISLLLICFFVFYNSKAQGSKPITTGVPFLLVAADARAAGLGDQGVATSTDAYSQQWNPAKYAFAEEAQGLSISYTPYLTDLANDISLGQLTYYNKINFKSAFAASFRYFGFGGIELRQTGDPTEPVREVTPNEFALDGSYSLKLSEEFSMAVGARFINSNLKVASENVDAKAASSFAVDVAAFYQSEEIAYNSFNGRWRAGINLQNMGPKISYDNDDLSSNFLPANLRIGAGFDFILDDYNKVAVSAELTKLMVPTPPGAGTPVDANGDGDYDDDGDISQSEANNIAYNDYKKIGWVSGMFKSFGDAPSAYTSYQLLSRSELPLNKGGKRELKLPNGRRLEARLEDRLADGSSRFVASINRPDARDFLPLLEVKARAGQKFIVAGQSYKRGILVLVFKVLR